MESSPQTPHLRPLLWLVAAALFIQTLDSTIVNTALPAMAAAMGESALAVHGIVVSYTLTMALLIPASGWLADRFGTKRVFSLSLVLFAIGSLLCAASSQLEALIAARVVQGMGAAMLMPVGRLAVLRAVPRSEFLAAISFIAVPGLLGPLVGPSLGGWLVEYASWHWIFLINVPIGLIGIVMTQRLMPNYYAPDGERPHFDALGFLLFSSGAVSLSLAVEMLNHPGAGLFASVCAAFGLLALMFYRQHALHDPQALYTPDLLKVRTFRLGILGNTVSRLGMASVPFLLPLLLQVAFGRSASISGWVLAPIALAALLTKPMVKPLLTRFGYRHVLIWNTRLIGLMIMALSLPNADTPLWLLIPLLFALGMCNSLQYSTMNTLTLSDLRIYQASSGNSLMAVNQQLAISIGIALGALLLNWFSRSAPPQSVELANAFEHTFLIIGAITFCSSWVFARLHPQDGSSMVAKKA